MNKFFHTERCSYPFSTQTSVTKETKPLMNLLCGPLSLALSEKSPLVMALEQKLLVQARGTRPKYERCAEMIRLGIRNSNQYKDCTLGESFSCTLCSKGDELFSDISFDQGGDYWLLVKKISGSNLIIETQDREEICLHLPKLEDTNPPADLLDGVLYWGTDLFFRTYGSREYKVLGQGIKLEMVSEPIHYFVYPGQNGFLVLENERWREISSLKEDDGSLPLAQVKELGMGILEIQVWDPEGFSLGIKRVQGEKHPISALPSEPLITNAKMRTTKQISCKMGKKRMMIKAGDWLIKTQTGWHKLNGAEEIELFLQHQIKGELVVIDQIETHGKVTGHHFDPMRIKMQPILVQAATSKKKEKKKRQGAFSL